MRRTPPSRRALARVLLAAAPVVALAACSDGGTAPQTPATPMLRFTYDGAMAGSFRAEGAPVLNAPQFQQSFAQGRREGGVSAGLEVLAVQRRAGNLADVVTISGLPQQTGTYTIDDSRCARTEPRCPGILVGLEIPTDASVAQARASCTLRTGTIRVTAWTAGRAAGDFAGEGRCLTSDGRTLEGFRVTGGVFDVALFEVTHL